MLFVGANLMARPCFAAKVPELARPILGERGDTGGEKGIANRLRC